MLKRIKDSIFDILRQADWLLLCLCCGAALFGLVMICQRHELSEFLEDGHRPGPAPLCWEWASIFSCPRST